MTMTFKGAVVLRSVPNREVEERIAAYLCRFHRNMPYEQILALVRKSKPLTLLRGVSSKEGPRIAAELNRLGASAFFVQASGAELWQ